MSHRLTPDPSPRLRRCLLAVPASSMKMMTKAATTDADAVFLDLEDAVSAGEKAAARLLVVTALREIDWSGTGKTISLRVNGLDTSWTYRDLVDVLEAAGDRIDTVILPKVGGPEDLYAADCLITQIATAKGFAPPALEGLIETAAGAANLEAIARYNRDIGKPRLEALHFGAGDFAASIQARTVDIGGLNPDYPGDQFHAILSRIVAACRANGLVPMDSAFGDFGDPAGYDAAARRASSLGMAGKWAIHPAQIPLANAVFSPSEDEVTRARGILAALDLAAAEGKGAAAYEGRMIDAANERMARSVLAIHDRIKTR
ncbi:CoA ester lyase [Alphaproteobacteria bacterium LSUCC0684]